MGRYKHDSFLDALSGTKASANVGAGTRRLRDLGATSALKEPSAEFMIPVVGVPAYTPSPIATDDEKSSFHKDRLCKQHSTGHSKPNIFSRLKTRTWRELT